MRQRSGFKEQGRQALDEALRNELLAMLPRLRRFAYGLTGSRDGADELTQATCERAIGEIRRFQPGTRLDSWLYRIARNLFLNELRSQRTRRSHLQLVMTTAADDHRQSDGARDMEARLSFAELRGFVARLPEEQQSVLLLVTVEGLSYQEVAEVLDLPPGTIASRIARARAALKDWMDGREPPLRQSSGPDVKRETGR